MRATVWGGGEDVAVHELDVGERDGVWGRRPEHLGGVGHVPDGRVQLLDRLEVEAALEAVRGGVGGETERGPRLVVRGLAVRAEAAAVGAEEREADRHLARLSAWGRRARIQGSVRVHAGDLAVLELRVRDVDRLFGGPVPVQSEEPDHQLVVASPGELDFETPGLVGDHEAPHRERGCVRGGLRAILDPHQSLGRKAARTVIRDADVPFGVTGDHDEPVRPGPGHGEELLGEAQGLEGEVRAVRPRPADVVGEHEERGVRRSTRGAAAGREALSGGLFALGALVGLRAHTDAAPRVVRGGVAARELG